MSTRVSTPAIEIRGLVKHYGAHTAVDGIDLTVAEGETLALLGPNGAGKTTTVECCEGYRRPDGGTVRVLGLDPHRDGAALKPRLGLMLQEGGIYPMARPDEVLRLFASFYRNPLDPDALLEEVGLAGTRRTRFRDLSGGQKQRLALALALVGRPEVVFLDEPTAGLDPSARRMTWQHIRGLQEQGVAIVLTTHLLDEAEELADRVVIIDRGHIIAEGTPDELTHSTQYELVFTAPPGLVFDGAVPEATISERRPGRYVLEGEVTPEVIARLTAHLAERDVLIGELQASKRSLEQVFLELIEKREGGR